jgi:hypothetical protein
MPVAQKEEGAWRSKALAGRIPSLPQAAAMLSSDMLWLKSFPMSRSGCVLNES